MFYSQIETFAEGFLLCWEAKCSSVLKGKRYLIIPTVHSVSIVLHRPYKYHFPYCTKEGGDLKVKASGRAGKEESRSPKAEDVPSESRNSLVPFMPVHRGDTPFSCATGYAKTGDHILVAYHCLLHNLKISTRNFQPQSLPFWVG